MKKNILVTGAAGFIGYHLCKRLVKEGYFVLGLDNINDYYDTNLKYDRLLQLGISTKKATVFNEITGSTLFADMFFIRMNLEDKIELPKLFKNHEFEVVCNLAAQAGVRYSLENPMAYIDSNIIGFMNLLECCRHAKIKRLVYASSSSVYGNTKNVPFNENHIVDHPVSLYAATKKSNELMAHTYSNLYHIETIGLRFFTVYGPWGRPDMAMFLFTEAILNNKPIKVFNNGNLSRDFTYIDDIIDGVYKTLHTPLKVNYNILNIGNSRPVKLMEFIKTIEDNIGKKAIKKMMPMQPGDVNKTWADTDDINELVGYKPKTNVNEGVSSFIKWYLEYFNFNQELINHDV
ncbi:NAD-dependent epimerase [Nonlabens sp.]|uniref:NAD-dependent epimerase n=1 Tax=Nonlabens sp. TaxID=1888209 RepID=UPI003F69C873